MNTPILKSPSGEKKSSGTTNESNQTIVLILSGIIICLLLIIFFMIIKPSTGNQKITLQEETNHERVNKNIRKKEKKEIHKTFNKEIQIEWEIKKTQAEQENMPDWSNENYNNALKLEEKAKSLKQDNQFNLAEESYGLAIAIIDNSLNERIQIQNELIEKAEKLFNNEKYTQAKAFFERSKKINNDNDKIDIGLKKIDDRIKVISLYKSALLYKDENKFNQALETLEKAKNIEPDNEKINHLIQSIKEEINDISFKQNIGNILEYIENNDFENASKELSKANALKPDEPIIIELKSRIKTKSDSLAIKRYEKKGKEFEIQEQWQSALNIYKKINNIDPYTIGGKVNEQRVRAYLDINKKLNEIIIKPERLQNNKIFIQSKETINNINKEVRKGNVLLFSLDKTPKLKQKIKSAEQIISDASKEITLTILSDNETSVVIYRVGKLGQFKSKKIKLRPGKYTIVGTKKNYRDVRTVLTLKPDQEKIDIYIECREKI